MPTAGVHTYQELNAQPDAWASVIETMRARVDELVSFFREGEFEALAFTGCGSTYYLSLAAASWAGEWLAMPAWGLPASEIWLRPREALPARGRTLLIAASRSGETTETLRACRAFLETHAGSLLTLSCYPDRPLAELGEINLVFPQAQEVSVAQTRAFSSLYLAALALIAFWANRPEVVEVMTALPQAGRDLLAQSASLAKTLASDSSLDRFYFLASGPSYGLACELSLKMKEMSLSQSEPFHFLEFRHGPQSMVGRSTLIVGLLSGSNQANELAVLEEMRGKHAHTVSIGEGHAEVSLPSGLSEFSRSVLYLPFGQLLAYERAMSRGLDPDHPQHLEAVVKLAGNG
jgi:glucosamine--fructose-6-phosphate aminotransferase (isomerizing)